MLVIPILAAMDADVACINLITGILHNTVVNCCLAGSISSSHMCTYTHIAMLNTVHSH